MKGISWVHGCTQIGNQCPYCEDVILKTKVNYYGRQTGGIICDACYHEVARNTPTPYGSYIQLRSVVLASILLYILLTPAISFWLYIVLGAIAAVLLADRWVDKEEIKRVKHKTSL